MSPLKYHYIFGYNCHLFSMSIYGYSIYLLYTSPFIMDAAAMGSPKLFITPNISTSFMHILECIFYRNASIIKHIKGKI